MKYLFSLLILFKCITGFAQNKATDSLLTLIKTDKEDTVKVNDLDRLCREYINNGEYDKSLPYSKDALALSKTLGFKKGIANSYSNIGLAYDYKGDYSEALKYYLIALKMRKEIRDTLGIAISYNNVGYVYTNLGNYPEALKDLFASLKIYEEKNNKKGIGDLNTNIGIIHVNEDNYPEALKNYFTALKIYQELNDKQGIADLNNNIGLVYMYQNNDDLALENYLSSLKIRKEIGDKDGIATSYGNIGIVYMNQGKYAEALKMDLDGLKIYEELGDKNGIANSFVCLGELYTKQHKTQEAKMYLNKALQLSKEMGAKDHIRSAYAQFVELDCNTDNFKDAFQHYKMFIVYRDSLNNEESKKKSLEASMQYEFDKKEFAAKEEQEKADAINVQEKQKQRLFSILVSCILILVLIFAVFMYRRFKITQKQKNIIEEQKALVEIKSRETEEQKNLVEEKQKEIIDSITYAKRLQQAILPSAEEIKKHLQDTFIYYKPKDIVAGDFYWMESVESESQQISNSLILFAAADSTGHGVPGAMVSVVCSNALNRAVKEFGLRDTGKILDKTRELVLETFVREDSYGEKSGEKIKDGMDISLLAINKASQLVYWSGANNPLWYISNGELKEIKADKQSIGKTDTPKPFTTHSIQFLKGDTFYLFTDGFADQFGGEKGKKLKYKQFEEMLIVNSKKSLEEQKNIISGSFEEWKGSLEQVDDVTVIGIRL